MNQPTPSNQPVDALVVCSRTRNYRDYEKVFAEMLGESIPRVHAAEGIRILDMLGDDQEMKDIVGNPTKRVLGIVDAPVANFQEYPCLDVVRMTSRRVYAELKQVLIVNVDRSHTLREVGRKPEEGIQFETRQHGKMTQYFVHDAHGPAKLIADAKGEMPKLDILEVRDDDTYARLAVWLKGVIHPSQNPGPFSTARYS
jgi:hypothetical protein